MGGSGPINDDGVGLDFVGCRSGPLMPLADRASAWGMSDGLQPAAGHRQPIQNHPKVRSGSLMLTADRALAGGTGRSTLQFNQICVRILGNLDISFV
jgi:hypothetical protein